MKLSRRGLLKLSATATGGLALGFSLSGCKEGEYQHGSAEDFRPNAFLAISEDNTVTLQIHRAEMGQGVMTGITQIVAEEFDLAPSEFVTELSGLVNSELASPDTFLQITGGSQTIASSYQSLREVGAAARAMLLNAAAEVLQVPVGGLTTDNGHIVSDGKKHPYGRFVKVASKLPVPEQLTLKDAADFQYIGQSEQRLDSQAKVSGQAEFGIDIYPEDFVTAVMLRSPSFGGQLIDFDAAEALKVKGVIDVIAVNNAVTVVAKSYWPARKAAGLITVNWDSSATANLSSASILAEQQRLAASEQGENITAAGSFTAADGDKTLSVSYEAPYLAHATMEPMNAVADYHDGKVSLWGGHQGADITADMVARALGISRHDVTVHSCFLGGGFGRRIVPDYMAEAAMVSRQVGQPVKLIWSREDDMAHDYYRPSHYSELSASISADNKVSWHHKLVGPSLLRDFMPDSLKTIFPEWVPGSVATTVGKFVASTDGSSVEGAAELPYGFAEVNVDYVEYTPPVPIGFWRSVGHSQNAFVVEAFVDEVAEQVGSDPLAFRLANLSADSAEAKVLQQVKVLSNWGAQVEGRFQGVAVHHSFGSTVAEVVEISMVDGKPKVETVYCVADCGQVINPDLVVTQMQSAIIFALTAALYGEITIEAGAVVQSNFHNYPMLRINETPDIVVELIESSLPPTGVGEPGVPPLAPALANALYAASAVRHRSLPIKV
ncbi:Isoquinoline 1-oxidoreductase subunit beta [Sinobacterium norvegicum]|uniref:Isoquinoline 1-oxidoreductase subunit beta n=1 Tax=Sinobacterium norvegicum TaxID=1641715 RepID=A0ABM9AB15_9GAMM|nr:molybdopterin cofactor-binding domain-containing protein [Sinobacterium norvegicum]CAH0990178.1 Isoquinoline 1-oxidoreductase subunit beta [Sinobacterium norvegicum]